MVSINIVGHFQKIKENCSTLYCNSHKFNLNKIKNKDDFKFDKHYLSKMHTDTNFLRFSLLNKYFNFVDFSDPFLLGLTKYFYDSATDLKDNKLTLPLTDDLYDTIKLW